MHILSYICTQRHIYMWIYMCGYTYLYVYIYTYTYKYVHTCIYTCIYQDFLSRRKVSNLNLFGKKKKKKIPKGGLQMVLWKQMTSQDL